MGVAVGRVSGVEVGGKLGVCVGVGINRMLAVAEGEVAKTNGMGDASLEATVSPDAHPTNNVTNPAAKSHSALLISRCAQFWITIRTRQGGGKLPV